MYADATLFARAEWITPRQNKLFLKRNARVKKESLGLIAGMILLFGFYIGAENYYIKKNLQESAHPPSQIQANTQTVVTTAGSDKPNQTSQPDSPTQASISPSNDLETFGELVNQENAFVSVPYATFHFTKTGGCIGDNFLTQEKQAYNNPQPVSVIENYQICKAFGVKVGDTDMRSSPSTLWKKSENNVVVVQKTEKFEVIKKFVFSQVNYIGHIEISVKNLTDKSLELPLSMEIGATSDNKNAGGLFSSLPAEYHGAAIMLADGSVKRELTPFESSPERKIILEENQIYPQWINVESLYWMNALVPQFHTPLSFTVVRTGFNLKKDTLSAIDQTVYEAWMSQNLSIAPGQTQSFSYKMYFGPKDEKVLNSFKGDKLDESIDYGFFKIIARPLYYVLSFVQGIVKNWGIAIIVLTILINIVLLPLQIKGYSSAQKMQVIQPKIKELQEKYKDDKTTLQRETMSMMSQQGVNPLSGCLPLLPQIPVFFGLNSTMQHTFELRQSPFFFWIHDLTRHDPYFVLPILMAFLMLGYQKMMPMPSMDPNQAKMMKFLPIIFSLFMLVYPAGLALYVITNTVFSMARQAVLSSHFNKKK